MWKSTIDRINAGITTSQLKLSWSLITGNLESIISLPDNFEWVGRSNLIISFQNKDGQKIPCEITDLDFSEYYNEKSFGILQTLYLDSNRIKILYYALYGLPAIFIRYELLINQSLLPDVRFIPFCFNLNKEINDILIKQVIPENKELVYLQTNTGNILLIYVENGTDIEALNIDTKEARYICVNMLNNECIYNKTNVNIKLPLIYIYPVSSYMINEIQALHYKIIDAHRKYEKWVSEKNNDG